MRFLFIFFCFFMNLSATEQPPNISENTKPKNRQLTFGKFVKEATIVEIVTFTTSTIGSGIATHYGLKKDSNSLIIALSSIIGLIPFIIRCKDIDTSFCKALIPGIGIECFNLMGSVAGAKIGPKLYNTFLSEFSKAIG